jgi:hypothetical protein
MYYIGMHRTEDREDRYLGSGNRLRRAMKKYGRENFKKEIIFECKDEQEMFVMEDEFIDLDDPLCYNLCKGGRGGNLGGTPWNKNVHMWATRPNPNLGKRGTKGWPKNVPRPQSTRDNIKKSLKEKFPNGRIAPNKGKKQTPEQIAANSECHKGMFGMINDSTKERKFCRAGTSIPDGWTRIPSRMSWIHNSETKESIQILAKQPIPEGWVRGKFGGSFKDNHKNKIRICNPITNEEKFHPKDQPIPSGWQLGMIKGRKKDKIFIHNISTLKIDHISKNDPIPEGWARGKRPNANTPTLTATQHPSPQAVLPLRP